MHVCMCVCVCVCVCVTSEPQAWVERLPGLSQASLAALSPAPLPRWLKISVQPGGEGQ